jgi:hypothetical protein
MVSGYRKGILAMDANNFPRAGQSKRPGLGHHDEDGPRQFVHGQNRLDEEEDGRDDWFDPEAWDDIDDDEAFDPEPVADDVRDDFALDEDDDVGDSDSQFWDDADEG